MQHWPTKQVQDAGHAAFDTSLSHPDRTDAGTPIASAMQSHWTIALSLFVDSPTDNAIFPCLEQIT